MKRSRHSHCEPPDTENGQSEEFSRFLWCTRGASALQLHRDAMILRQKIFLLSAAVASHFMMRLAASSKSRT